MLKQEDCNEFKNSLRYRVKACLKTTETNYLTENDSGYSECGPFLSKVTSPVVSPDTQLHYYPLPYGTPPFLRTPSLRHIHCISVPFSKCAIMCLH